MIDTGVANALLVALIGGIGGILGAIAVWIQQRAKANAHTTQLRADGQLITEKARADGYTMQEKTSNTAIETLAKIAERGVDVQERMVSTVERLTRTIDDNASQMRGMLLMQESHTKGLRDVVENVDAVSMVIPKIDTRLQAISAATTSIESTQTSLGDSLKDQLGSILVEITKVTVSISELVTEMQNTSGQTNNRLIILIESVKAADKRVMDLLGQFVTDHIKDFLPADTNGQPTDVQSLPVKIEITSASPKEPKS